MGFLVFRLYRAITPALLIGAALSTSVLHAQEEGTCEDPTVTVAVEPQSVPEGDEGTTEAAYEIAVDVGDDACCFVSVDWGTEDGSAIGGDDYVALASTNNEECGDLMIEGSLNVLGDTVLEPDETFDLVAQWEAATDPVGCPPPPEGECVIVDDIAGQGLPGVRPADHTPFPVSQTVTIENDDQTSVVIDDVQVEEGNSGTTGAVFTVRAEPLAIEPVDVSFQTADGTATEADGDYEPQSASVTIEPVEPYEASISVPVVGNTQPEEDETFTVRLTSADGGEITDGEGVGTILDDDEPSGQADLSVSVEATVESNPTVTFAVEAMNNGPAEATGAAVTVDLPTCAIYESDDCGGDGGPPFVWTIGDLANQEAETCNVTAEATQCEGEQTVSVTVAAEQQDPSPENNTAETTFGAEPVPALPMLAKALLTALLSLAAVWTLRWIRL